ncbi:hypothetical protein PHAVU_006G058300 [Phaseolus vulgaris]|uniref:Uncharacterized protein n=1 Tax=Phaseolus vulgaris TaxID=3885 RepID=V7BL25_PHAVU|nr:hypothetical protein PHAVU_006G058300g [Phaseolus vulgaris]ESW18647.1 hypothetical protein PHAVU_006G058300g [Phaseolus vulgaris]
MIHIPQTSTTAPQNKPILRSSVVFPRGILPFPFSFSNWFWSKILIKKVSMLNVKAMEIKGPFYHIKSCSL